MKNPYAFFLCSFQLLFVVVASQLPLFSGASVLHFATDGRITEHINPRNHTIINQKILQHALFATLFRFEEMAQPKPFLVKSVSFSEQIAQLELHDNLRFSDGRPIRSQDVIRSLKDVLKLSLAESPLVRYIEGAERFISGEAPDCSGLILIDQKRFQIRYRHQFSTLSQLLSEAATAIVPEDWQADDKVFSGPYLLEKRAIEEGHETIFLKPNPFWTLSRPTLSQIMFHYYQDSDAFASAIRKGEPDYFLISYGNDFPIDNSLYRIVSLPTNGQIYVLLNPKSSPFNDIEWRYFFKELILDLGKDIQENRRGAINTRLVMPYGLPGYDLFKPIKPGRVVRPQVPDQEFALLFHLNRSPLREKLFNLLKKKLAPHRVGLIPIWEHISVTMPRVRAGEFTMTAFYYLSDTPSSINFFERLFIPSQELNPGAFSVDEAIALINSYYKETNDLEQMRILAQLESIAQDSSFLIPVLGISYTLGSRLGRPVIKTDRFLNLYLDQFRLIHEH